jgi:diguanylate cyclase (GGDEF)-like protein
MGDWDEQTKNTDEPQAKKRPEELADHAYLIVLAGSNVGEMYRISSDAMVIGRGQNAEIHVIDEGISRVHARVIVATDEVHIEDMGSTNGTYVNGERIVSSEPLRDGDKIQIGSTTILKFTYHDRLEEDFQRQMYESALRDGLTRAFNKKYFVDRLQSEFAYAVRHKVPLSLIMFDIDFFKHINDTHGHLAGDFVLAELSRRVLESIRGEDVFARYGGEEFVLICRGIESRAATAFGERLRRIVETEPFLFGETALKATISVGIAALPNPANKDPTTFLAAADDALYEAKRTGRNRVVGGTR